MLRQFTGSLGVLDGFVGIEDLNTVLSNWNASTTFPDFPTGDATGDRFVGIEDLNWVLGNWNAGTPPASSTAVPEPASAILLAAVCIASLRRPGAGAMRCWSRSTVGVACGLAVV